MAGTFTAKTLATQAVPTTPGTAYTVPASTTTRVTEILLSNNAGAARVVNIWFVETGDSADTSNEITGGGMSVPTGIPWRIALNTIMEAADTIQIDADGADVAIIISGVEES